MKYLLFIVLISLMMTGCATKSFVDAEIESSEMRTQAQINDLKAKVEETQTEIRNLSEELDVKLEGFDETRKMAEENAERIAKMGHITFRKTLSDAQAFFETNSANLSGTAISELDKFAQLIKRQNKTVHIEIQGHTDNVGSKNYNRTLGEKRAIAVREMLYRNYDIPLHLMNVISMGPDYPIADNETEAGRAKNRRVVLVVRVPI